MDREIIMMRGIHDDSPFQLPRMPLRLGNCLHNIINRRKYPFDVNSDSLEAEIDVINKWAEDQLDLVEVSDLHFSFLT